MPIVFWNCIERDIALCRWSGLVTPDEFRANYEDYIADPNFRAGRTELIDLTELKDFVGNFRTIRAAVDYVNRAGDGFADQTRSVAIAPHSGVYGLGRMWQQLSEATNGFSVELHRSEAEALAALDLPYTTISDFFAAETLLAGGRGHERSAND